MEIIKKYALMLLSLTAFSQSNQTVSVINNYNGWKWDKVYVTKNNYISLAVVPEAGGRILEYNLGDVPSLWVNPKLVGQSFEYNEEVKMSDWRNFGGYRLVPIPVDNCAVDMNGNRTKRWPPPVMMGDSPYIAEITTNKNGDKTINVTSGIQQLPVPLFNGKLKQFSKPTIEEELQYSRSLYLEDRSSLVYMTHTLKNVGAKPVKRGIMTSSQHVSRSKPELTDGENFVTYIPFSKDLKLEDGEQFHISTKPEWHWNFVNKNRMPLDKSNPEHLEKYFNIGTNWTGEVAPGIFEIHYDYYLMAGFHMIASKPWICYANKLNNTVFAKIFEPYNDNLDYEFGINIAVYNSGMETGYLETEVKTPLYDLKPGDSFDYLEIQAAAKVVSLPVLDVNKTGIITKKLSLNKESKNISGDYGVFIEGKAVLQFIDVSGNVIKEVFIKEVNPLKAFSFEMKLNNLTNIFQINLAVKEANDQIRLLDSLNLNDKNDAVKGKKE